MSNSKLTILIYLLSEWRNINSKRNYNSITQMLQLYHNNYLLLKSMYVILVFKVCATCFQNSPSFKYLVLKGSKGYFFSEYSVPNY